MHPYECSHLIDACPSLPYVQMEEYLALSRKDLFIEISPKEIQLIHSLLLKYIDNLVGCVL